MVAVGVTGTRVGELWRSPAEKPGGAGEGGHRTSGIGEGRVVSGAVVDGEGFVGKLVGEPS